MNTEKIQFQHQNLTVYGEYYQLGAAYKVILTKAELKLDPETTSSYGSFGFTGRPSGFFGHWCRSIKIKTAIEQELLSLLDKSSNHKLSD